MFKCYKCGIRNDFCLLIRNHKTEKKIAKVFCIKFSSGNICVDDVFFFSRQYIDDDVLTGDVFVADVLTQYPQMAPNDGC